jgi:hypothetical protein
MPIDFERRNALRATAVEHLRKAYGLMDEAEDGTACYLIECALDEITSQELGAPRDSNVVPLVPRK